MSDLFLEGFSKKEIKQIEKAGVTVTVPAGWSPMWEGTGPDKAYVIREGEVSIRRGGAEIAKVYAGDIVGELGIVNGRLRNATVVAVTPLEVLRLSRDEVKRLSEAMPHFREQLQAAMTRHGVAPEQHSATPQDGPGDEQDPE